MGLQCGRESGVADSLEDGNMETGGVEVPDASFSTSRGGISLLLDAFIFI